MPQPIATALSRVVMTAVLVGPFALPIPIAFAQSTDSATTAAGTAVSADQSSGSSAAGAETPAASISGTQASEPAQSAPAISNTGPAPTLNLDQLESRVRDTPAIGFFTKLQLKGEIDDLLDELERYHQSESDLVLDELQSRYELLFLKLLTLLQDDDPGLHQDVAAARTEIWAILSDPVRFREARDGSVS